MPDEFLEAELHSARLNRRHAASPGFLPAARMSLSGGTVAKISFVRHRSWAL